MTTKEQKQAVERAVRRAVLHLGDASNELIEADRLTGNHEFMTLANKISPLIRWAEDIPVERR